MLAPGVVRNTFQCRQRHRVCRRQRRAYEHHGHARQLLQLQLGAWGGGAQVGMTYFLDRSWFLDFNYTYARTGQFTDNYTRPFTSTSNGYTTTGTAYLTAADRVTTQSVAVSINTAF